jgi:hypothetical protein
MDKLHVDANKVMHVLKEQLSESHLQNAILQVALMDAQEKAADLMKELAIAADENRELLADTMENGQAEKALAFW